VYPLLYDIRYRLQGDGNGFRMTLHRQYNSYFNAGEPHWYNRWVDGSVGWTDGRAEMVVKWVGAGQDPLSVDFGQERW
jgi:hypothetical protein